MKPQWFGAENFKLLLGWVLRNMASAIIRIIIIITDTELFLCVITIINAFAVRKKETVLQKEREIFILHYRSCRSQPDFTVFLNSQEPDSSGPLLHSDGFCKIVSTERKSGGKH